MDDDLKKSLLTNKGFISFPKVLLIMPCKNSKN